MLLSQRGDLGGSFDKALYEYENKPLHRPPTLLIIIEKEKGKIREKRKKRRRIREKGKKQEEKGREQEKLHKGCLLQLPEAGSPHDPVQEPHHS